MKKAAVILLATLLISSIFVGCSSSKESSESQKTEEELKAEIRAEMEKEEKKKEELKAELKAQLSAEQNKEDDSNLDWALDYMNKDISELQADMRGGVYSNDYGQLVKYEYNDYTIYFSTTDEHTIEQYPEDFEKAGITENTITSIALRMSHELYDYENEKIIRYPQISVGGACFGMDFSSMTEKWTINNEEYSVEYEDNSVYSKNKIVGIHIRSQIEEDVLDGKYAPEFTIEPLDPNTPVKKIDVGMTKDEIINILGPDYKEETLEDEFLGGEYTHIIYDGVSINLDGVDGKVNHITISTNKVTGKFDISVGDSALEALKYCKGNLEEVKNHFGMDNEVFFNIYEFKEGVSVELIFDNYGNINSMEDVEEDTVVQEIRIFNTDYIYGV